MPECHLSESKLRRLTATGRGFSFTGTFTRFQCGRKTHTFRRGCENCFGVSQITCKKCRRRGHYAQDCPDNWRAYHNTVSLVEPGDFQNAFTDGKLWD